MKLHYMSDLHLEFGDMLTPEGGEVLVLAGDIHVGMKGLPWIDRCLDKYEQVYLVLGNHEFYRNNYHQVLNQWLEAAKDRDNLEVLHNHVHAYDGVRFIGTTLWTPSLRYGLNDYNVIQYNNRLLEPTDTQGFYVEAQKFLEHALAQPFLGRTVVVTHHAPIPECVVPKFKGHPINECFHCNLNHMIADNDIAYWIHGHMHDSIFFDYEDTTIACNPRGYVGHGANWGFRNPEEIIIL